MLIVSKGIQGLGFGAKARVLMRAPSDTQWRRPEHSIDDLQDCARSRRALRKRAMTMMMGEKDSERIGECTDPVLNLTDMQVRR